jgi:tetratricopeptide (TPR) repeat protein
MPVQTQPQSLAIRSLDIFLIATLLLFTFLLGCFKQRDTDIWWHFKAGQMILERGELPDKDWFTFTSTERDWIDLHWLFQIAAAGMYALGGFKLLTVASAAMGTLAVAIQLVMRRPAGSVPVAVAVWFPFLIMLGGRLYVRPEIITLLCLSVFLAVLFHAERHPRWLVLLLPVQCLWVNVQGLFILGLLLAGIYWVDGVWRQICRDGAANLKARSLLVVGLVVASLANAYGFKGLIFPIELFAKMSWDSAFYSKHISELQSISQFVQQAGYWHFYVVLHMFLLALAAASTALQWISAADDLVRRMGKGLERPASHRLVGSMPGDDGVGLQVSPFRTLTFLVFTWLSLQATRNSGQFSIVVGAITAWNMCDWLAVRNERRGTGGFTFPSISSISPPAARFVPIGSRVGLVVVVLLSCVFVASGRFYALAGEGRIFGLGEHPFWNAHGAARFAAQPGMPQRVLAFHLGQAAVFEFHKRDDQRTYCDPRLEVVSRDLLRQYHAIESLIASNDANWQSALSREQIAMILVNHETHSSLDATLLSTPEWSCVYFDAIAAVYVRRDATSALGLPQVDFGQRLFRGDGEKPIQTADSVDSQADTDSLVARVQSAQALFRVSRSLMERGAADLRMRRAMLLLAAKTCGPESKEDDPPELDRLRGQIYMALATLTGRDLLTDGFAEFRWDPSSLLDLTRARYYLDRAWRRKPDDFIALVHLYTVAKLQSDRTMQDRVGSAIVRRGPRTPAERTLVHGIEAEWQQFASDDRNPAGDWAFDPLARREAILNRLAQGRPDVALRFFPTDSADRQRMEPDMVDLYSGLSLLLGQPQFVLDSTLHPSDENTAASLVLRGHAQLIMGSLRASIDTYRQAIEAAPENIEAHIGLARAYLDLGDAKNTTAEARRALALQGLSDLERHQLEWMAEMSQPFAE